uniref:Pantothenate kinase n=1 Tax=Herpetomonas muscarum TaxID=5718 RepID=T1YUR2_HERMU|nr:pantothenate kinase [Herpetomonas muscarum]
MFSPTGVSSGSSKEARNMTARARVLSYNFNILPRGCGGYQEERLNTFLKSVDSYDVLLLQEVYATSVMPYAMQRRFCYKKELLDGLKEKGFHHYVISRQPSYTTMMRHNVLSDNGLVIASRFPIWHRGSYTFRNRDRAEPTMAKGCLFAEIEVPSCEASATERVVFFNAHLRPEERAPSDSSQVQQMVRLVESVLQQLKKDTQGYESEIPFIIAGDFNIHGIEAHTRLPSKALIDFMAELDPLGDLRDAIVEKLGFNPPTRPPKLFFPTQSKLEKYEDVPQRQDYLLVNDRITVDAARLEKFVVSSRRPYTYLSDHFGVVADLAVAVENNAHAIPRSPSRLMVPSLVEEVDHELSNPTSSSYMENVVLLLVATASFSFSFKLLLLLGVAWVCLRFPHVTLSSLSSERLNAAALVTDAVVKGEATVSLPSRGYDPLSMTHSIAGMWDRSVTRFRSLRCLGTTGEMGQEEWLSYGAVDQRARDLGAGLLEMGLVPGDVVGVECDACRNAVFLDIACALYGFATLPLAGKSSTVRQLLDQNKVRIVFASRSAVVTLLTCRSTSLETIVHFHPFTDSDDQAVAKDLNIKLLSYSSVEHNGRLQPQSPPEDMGASTVFTYSMDNVSSTDFATPIPITHADILRDISMMFKTSVLPNYFQRDLMVWFTPIASLFNRICVLGLFVQGNAVATSESTHLQEAFSLFRPTILVASSSLFSTSSLQLSRAKQRYSAVYNWLFDRVYYLRSQLIHVNNCDSALLRFLFFRSFGNQLGGNVHTIVLNATQESTPFYLLDHITVCYAPSVREVSYFNSVGVCTVDGVPVPPVRVELKPIDDLSQGAGIGALAVTRGNEAQQNLEIAARWEKNRMLTLLGSSTGVMWPVDYQYAISMELERVYVGSRYINDIFVYCEQSKPLVAVVCPNRDTVEFEWRQQQMGSPRDSMTHLPDLDFTQGATKQLSWTELAEYATPLITKDLKAIAEEHNLHRSQVPRFVHLHPHAFRDHATFLTPFGKIRRQNVLKYFSTVFERLYSETATPLNGVSPLLSEPSLDIFSDADTPVLGPKDQLQRKSDAFELRVPVTVDIGGTFAKIAYVMPPHMRDFTPGSSIIHEASSLTDKLGLRTFEFFQDQAAAEREVAQSARSKVGTLRFAKIPSQQIPRFAEYLASAGGLNSFKPETVRHIRATGGGAFKYAQMARSVVGVEFDVVKEMDAVVKGLNLIIKLSPESIFTVDTPTGQHMPHKLQSSGDSFSPFPYMLINIGSGISFIKCTGPDGAHVRVGGSPIGGATFWGLTRTMTNLTCWEEVMEIMQLDGPGDNKNVDLLVGDIYGYNAKDLPAMLSSETVGSSFGKFGTERFYDATRASPADHFAEDDAGEILSPLASKTPKRFGSGRAPMSASSMDIVRSLLFMISSNVTQLAFLHSKIHGVKNIFFAGGFVRNNPIVWTAISNTMHYWSGGDISAHFLEHDGYLGALGSAVLDTPPSTDTATPAAAPTQPTKTA